MTAGSRCVLNITAIMIRSCCVVMRGSSKENGLICFVFGSVTFTVPLRHAGSAVVCHAVHENKGHGRVSTQCYSTRLIGEVKINARSL